ncbi:pirin family protein [Bryobacter aggregatus]|uniref:pirin family protein n=1 Tax=Bryobacter aggregatus TaxID=360054 RepID=UPI0004E12DDD|nr:pirin family protein [Bryobacter aggregatus]
MSKKVLGVYGAGSNHWVGDGFPVRNLIPSSGVGDAINPFLMLDYAGPATFPPSNKARGVEEHPHRGFETVTIAYQGSVDHRDSGGNKGTIHPGDVQWMTAASGVVHEEKHGQAFTEAGGTFEMVQLWVNLPKAWKMSPPKYQEILNAKIPVVALGDGASARVIAGELLGTKGAATTFTPINVFDMKLLSGSTATVPLPVGHNSSVVLLRGEVTVNGKVLQGEAQIALLSPQGDSVTIAAQAESTLLILSGEPIDEPVASYGPFVMNTREELVQAMEDFRAGKMGRLP